MDTILFVAFNQVMRGQQPVSSLSTVFESLTTNEIDTNTMKETMLDVIWYLDSTILDGQHNTSDLRNKLATIARYIFDNHIVDAKLIKTRLDVSLLHNAGLVDEFNFNKRAVRINTAILYKQQKYNLMREESEGYSKIVCELASNCDPTFTDENENDRNQRANSLLELIKTLIGYFHLDPNRVLDLILDVFVVHVRSHHAFLLRLLELSPWQPSSSAVIATASSTIHEIKEDHWENDPGNSSCAHLLGSKFKYYQVSFTTTAGDNVFPSLYEVSALLIQKGFVQIIDLYPHIITKDTRVHEIGLANALLSIGDFYHAKFILYRLDTIPQSLAKPLCDIIHVSIVDIHNLIAPPIPKQKPPPSLSGSWYGLWHEGIPKFQSKDDIITESGRELLNLASPWLGSNIILFCKLLRIAHAHLKESEKGPNRKIVENAWHDIIRSVFLPSVSLLVTNPGVVNDFWQLLNYYPYEIRYGLYGEWKDMKTIKDKKPHPALTTRVNEVKRKTKGIMKRITEENYRQKGREIAKVSHSNPIVVFDIVLYQVQAYPNLINPMVEACKYLTPLSYDVLTYLILSILADKKDKIKDDKLNVSDWLQHLAQFCGNICRKYNTMDLKSILQYVVNQLKCNEPKDLIVLSQLISTMSGIEPTGIPSDMEVTLMGGGEHLRNIKLYNRTIEKNTRRSSARLAKTLIEAGLTVSIAVLIAQLTQVVPYSSVLTDFTETSADLKIAGHQIDNYRSIYIQYIDFLALNIRSEEYSNMIPLIVELCTEYDLQPEFAFSILRPKLKYMIKQQSSLDQMEVDGEPNVWEPSLRDFIKEVKEIHPPHVWTGISPTFYTTFWQLSLYDIECPNDEYIKSKNETIALSSDKRPRDKDKLLSMAKSLDSERKAHLDHVENIRQRLKREKDHWFSGQFSNRQDIITQFWQYCLFPRLLLSADNAVFCAKFIEIMHEIGTANFSTLTLYDRIFADQVQPITFTCTETEARNYGRFLHTVLKYLSSLHRDQKSYEAYGKGKGIPGFQMKWSSQVRQPTNIAETDLLQYEDFRRVFYKWHSKLLKAFEQCLTSEEYISLRNAMIVLNHIVAHFPAVETIGKKITSFIENIVQHEESPDNYNQRPDIKILAKSYLGKLSVAKKSWLPMKQFQTPKQTANNITNGNINNVNANANNSTSTSATATSPNHNANSSSSNANVSTPKSIHGDHPHSSLNSPNAGTSRSSPLIMQHTSHSSPRAPNSRTDSPRRQIHPLPDKPKQKEREKERERDRADRDRDRAREKKGETYSDREKDKDIVKKIDHHDREKDLKKNNNDYHEREKERTREIKDRMKQPEMSRSEAEKKDRELQKSGKDRTMIDDRSKRMEHHQQRIKDRDIRDHDRMKDKERDNKREDNRREDKKDKNKERERSRDPERERERIREEDRERERIQDRERHRADQGRRRHLDEPNPRRGRKIYSDYDMQERIPRDEREMMAMSMRDDRDRKRVFERDDDPDIMLKKPKIKGMPPPNMMGPSRGPVKLNRTVEHINELLQPLPGPAPSVGNIGKRGGSEKYRRRNNNNYN
nr:15373_t:CDS:10 [Entrophospora candida]